jgi:hypothetical protein
MACGVPYSHRTIPIASLSRSLLHSNFMQAYGWLEVECHRCKTRASLPLDAIRRPRDTPIWKLEAALQCRSCKKGRYAPPVHMIKLTTEREITPYKWVHPDEDR